MEQLIQGREGHARAVVMAVTAEEFAATRREFNAVHELQGSGCWSDAPPHDGSGTYPVVIAQSSDRSNTPAMESVEDLIEDWRPELVLLVGVAGGIVRAGQSGSLVGPSPGDVVIAEYIHYGEYTKNVDGERLRRYFPIDHPSARMLQRHARPLQSDPCWYAGLPVTRPSGATSDRPMLEMGELVAVEFLAGDGNTDQQTAVLSHFDHALAVDMESMGVARAIHAARQRVHYLPRWLCVRGISDRAAASPEAQRLLKSGNDAERVEWREYAAAAAARAARLILERFLDKERPPEAEDSGAPRWTYVAS